jgi:hypothetical protein
LACIACPRARAPAQGAAEQLARVPTSTSVGVEFALPKGYSVALPEKLPGEFNVYRCALQRAAWRQPAAATRASAGTGALRVACLPPRRRSQRLRKSVPRTRCAEAPRIAALAAR